MSEAREGGKTDTLVKILMVLFISLLSFSVGTFFGKMTTEKTMKQAQMESEADHESERETASIPPGSMDVKPEDALTEEELGKLAEEHEEAEKAEKTETAKDSGDGQAAPKTAKAATGQGETAHAPATAHGEKSAEKPKSQAAALSAHGNDSHEPANKFQKVQKAAERVANGHEPAPAVKAESRAPSSLPKQLAASSVGKYTVQISSHQAESEATKRAEDLKSKGFNAFFVKANVGGKTWYRVSIGLFPTRKEANNYVSTIKEKDPQINATLVQQIVE